MNNHKSVSFFIISILFILINISCNKEEPTPESPIGEIRIDNPVLNIPCYIGCNLSVGAPAEWYINEILVSRDSKFYYKFTEEGNFTILLKTTYKGHEFTQENSVEVYEPGLIIGDYGSLHDFIPQSATLDNNNLYVSYVESIPGVKSKYGVIKVDQTLSAVQFGSIPELEISGGCIIPSTTCYNDKLYILQTRLGSSLNIYDLPFDSLPTVVHPSFQSYETMLLKQDSIFFFYKGYDSSVFISTYDLDFTLGSFRAINIDGRPLKNLKVVESANNGFVLQGELLDVTPTAGMVIKTNSSFEVEWFLNFESYTDFFLQDILCDSENNVLILYSKNDTEYLLKVDNEGNSIWEISAGEVYGYSRNGSICEVPDGYVFSGGLHSGNGTTVHKVDKNGNNLWDARFCSGEVFKIISNKENGCTLVKRDSKDVIEKVYNDAFFPDDNVWGEDEGYYSISFISIFKLDKDGNVIEI